MHHCPPSSSRLLKQAVSFVLSRFSPATYVQRVRLVASLLAALLSNLFEQSAKVLSPNSNFR